MKPKPKPIRKVEPWGIKIGVGTIATLGTIFTLLLGLCIGLLTEVPLGGSSDVSDQLIEQQTEMQYLYEKQLLAIRGQLEQMTSALRDTPEAAEPVAPAAALPGAGGAVNPDLDARLGTIASRQQRIEFRHQLLSGMQSLAQQFELVPQAPGSGAPALAPPAPAAPPSPPTRPGDRSSLPAVPAQQQAAARIPPVPGFMASGLTPAERVYRVERSMFMVETQQAQSMSFLARRARDRMVQARLALADIGIDIDKPAGKAGKPGLALPPPPPVVAIAPAGGNAFVFHMDQLQQALTQFTRLKPIASSMPFGRPVAANESRLTSPFGYRMHPIYAVPKMHSGLDLAAPTGTPVRAPSAGVVSHAAMSGGAGNMVILEHGNNVRTRYLHLDQIDVQLRQIVTPGTVLGKVGTTGSSTGPHLHYETYVDGEAQDPMKFLKAGERFFQPPGR